MSVRLIHLPSGAEKARLSGCWWPLWGRCLFFCCAVCLCRGRHRPLCWETPCRYPGSHLIDTWRGRNTPSELYFIISTRNQRFQTNMSVTISGGGFKDHFQHTIFDWRHPSYNQKTESLSFLWKDEKMLLKVSKSLKDTILNLFTQKLTEVVTVKSTLAKNGIFPVGFSVYIYYMSLRLQIAGYAAS